MDTDLRQAEIARKRRLDRKPRTIDDPVGRVLYEIVTARSGSRLALAHRGLDDDSLAALLECPALGGVTHLDLRGNDLDARAAATLAAAPHLAALCWLDLSDNPLGASGLAALLDAPWAARLCGLRLRGCELDAHALHVLAEQPRPALEALDLSRNPPSRDPLSRDPLSRDPLSRAPRSRNPPLADGLDALAHAVLPALRQLDLSDCRLGPELGPALAAARRLGPLHALVLDRDPIGATGLHALLDAPCCASLATLSLRGCGLERELPGALGALARLAPTLQHLDLSHNPLGAPGLAALLDALAEARQLAALGLEGCELDDDDETTRSCLARLAAAPGLRHLAVSARAADAAR